MYLKRIKVNYGELALVYRNGKLVRLIREGKVWLLNLFNTLKVEKVDQRKAWIVSNQIDQIEMSNLVDGLASFIDLKDNERALVWIDGRLDSIIGPGIYGLWTEYRKVKVEVIDASEPRLVRKDQETLLKNTSANAFLQVAEVPEGKVGVLYVNGEIVDVLSAGKQVFWKDVAKIKVVVVEKREQALDVSGQEIMTQDKVTLRINGLLTYQIVDVRKSVEVVENVKQALYREAQLALRSQIGSRGLDSLLRDKEALASSTREKLERVAQSMGVRILGLGIRDIILPGDMKELMNQVIEAEKAAEANVIKRREETAAMRSQLNTAKLMSDNPVLMRLRELEVLESVSKTTNLQVVLGEQSLTDRLTKLI